MSGVEIYTVQRSRISTLQTPHKSTLPAAGTKTTPNTKTGPQDDLDLEARDDVLPGRWSAYRDVQSSGA